MVHMLNRLAILGVVLLAGCAARGPLTDAQWQDRVSRLPRQLSPEQRQWVRQDQLLDTQWKDERELAMRFAAATRVKVLRELALSRGVLGETIDIYLESRRLDDALTAAEDLDFEGLEQAIQEQMLANPARQAAHEAALELLSDLRDALDAELPLARAGEFGALCAVADLVQEFEALDRAILPDDDAGR